MVLVQDFSLFLQVRQKDFGSGVSGIATWNEDGVEVRELADDFGAFLERGLGDRRVLQVLGHRRVPHPDGHAVVGRDLRNPCGHVDGRQREVWAGLGVVGSRGHHFDGVRAEHDKVADILLPHGRCPGVVGVDLRPVSGLMPTHSDFGCGIDGQGGREGHLVGRHA